ncbi:MAG TPA: YIP1 family protein [Candidatus Brocadiia bacterium]|nr:YIP1 family protein [Candidatus Brocadiia bacterium]
MICPSCGVEYPAVQGGKCPRCGADAPDGAPDRPGLPWQQWREYGFLIGFIQTVLVIVFSPRRAFASMKDRPNNLNSLGFRFLFAFASASASIAVMIWTVELRSNPFSYEINLPLFSIIRMIAWTGGAMLNVISGAFFIHVLCNLLRSARPYRNSVAIMAFTTGVTSVIGAMLGHAMHLTDLMATGLSINASFLTWPSYGLPWAMSIYGAFLIAIACRQVHGMGWNRAIAVALAYSITQLATGYAWREYMSALPYPPKAPFATHYQLILNLTRLAIIYGGMFAAGGLLLVGQRLYRKLSQKLSYPLQRKD